MIIYLSVLALSVLLCRLLQEFRSPLTGRMRNPFAGGFCFLLTIVILGGTVGWRNGVGTDYGNYIDIYTLSVGKSLGQCFEGNEPLYTLLNSILGDLFDDYVAVFAFCGLVTMLLLMIGIYQNSSSMWLSVFLFITGMYYFDLFNGQRQMIATAIMFAGYPLARERKWIPLGLLTLLAYGFHASAPVVLLVYLFAVYTRPGGIVTWLMVIGCGVIYVGYDSFASGLVQFLVDTDSVYSNYEQMLANADSGANILRFALTLVPVLVSILTWSVLPKLRRDVGMLVNISLVNSLFMMIATKHWIFARFCMFFGVYNVLLWPELLDCFDKRSKELATWVVVAVYFVYFLLIVRVDSNLLPYRSWLFGGVYG